MSKELREIITAEKIRLEEANQGTKFFAVAGHADKPTANKTLYSRALWEKNIQRLQPALKAKKIWGALDHSVLSTTSLSDVSHIINDLKLDDNGNLWVEGEILKDTEKGKTLLELLKKGKVGLSTRGSGTTKEDDKGVRVVQDDYKLLSIDFVASPSADVWMGSEDLFESVSFEKQEIDHGEKKYLTPADYEDIRTRFMQALYEAEGDGYIDYHDWAQKNFHNYEATLKEELASRGYEIVETHTIKEPKTEEDRMAEEGSFYRRLEAAQAVNPSLTEDEFREREKEFFDKSEEEKLTEDKLRAQYERDVQAGYSGSFKQWKELFVENKE